MGGKGAIYNKNTTELLELASVGCYSSDVRPTPDKVRTWTRNNPSGVLYASNGATPVSFLCADGWLLFFLVDYLSHIVCQKDFVILS